MKQTAHYRLSGIRRLLWAVLAPLRWYVIHSPLPRGKGYLLRHVIVPSLPRPPATFDLALEPAGHLQMFYRESLGREILMRGSFEAAEIELCISRLRPGSTFVDVGANVGIFTIAVAASRPDVTVVAFEPSRENFSRLTNHVTLNGLSNVILKNLAVSDYEGLARLHPLRGDDGAYIRAVRTEAPFDPAAADMVQAHSLDLCLDLGCPPVSVCKVDVEGGELNVLNGALGLIGRDHPCLLLEANSKDALEDLDTWALQHGYMRREIAGVKPWNNWYVYRTEVSAAD